MLTAKRPRVFHLPLRTFRFDSFVSTEGGVASGEIYVLFSQYYLSSAPTNLR